MSTLLCFGLGYSAEHFVGLYGDGFERIVGTVRTAERATVLNSRLAGRLKALVFDGHIGDARSARRHRRPPSMCWSRRRPTKTATRCSPRSAMRWRKRGICARSSICRRSASMATMAAHGSTRRRRRAPLPRAAGRASTPNTPGKNSAPGAAPPANVAVLRLAGIYGPGQNALTQIAGGKARRVVKPGQIFNRIHVADIAQAIDAAFARAADGIFNVADDEPTPPADPLVFAAQLLGRDPPPEIPFDQAAASMSPMALSFWQECRRVRNDKLKRELGVTLSYPTYREGLRALFEAR